MRTLTALLFSLLLISCTYDQEESKVRAEINSIIPSESLKIDNDCVITAVNIHTALTNHKILNCEFKEIIFCEFKFPNNNKVQGHALTVFIYPAGSNKLYAADEQGTIRIREYIDTPLEIAKKFMAIRNPSAQITRGYYVTKEFYIEL